MSAMDDLTAAIAAEDDVIKKVVAYVTGLPAVIQAAVDAATAGDIATANSIITDVKAQTAALQAVLPATP